MSDDQQNPQALGPAAEFNGSHGLRSGLDLRHRDVRVRPADDPYRYLNGNWLDTFEIPPDYGAYGAFTHLDEQIQLQLKSTLEALAAAASAAALADTASESDPNAANALASVNTIENAAAADTAASRPTASAHTAAARDAAKLVDLYASFMDEAHIEALGLRPLATALADIDALADRRQIAQHIARCQQTGVDSPLSLEITPDPKASTRYAAFLSQSGLGLPDRDYYLQDDPKLATARDHYLRHVESMLRMAGDPMPERSARDILGLETSLAELHWTRVDNRDPIKTYHRFAIAELDDLLPGFAWGPYCEASGLGDRTAHIVIRQPSYCAGLGRLMTDVPLSVWKTYFRWRLLSAAAPYLAQAFVAERFAFVGTALRGVPCNLPRWKQGLKLVGECLGEALGRHYVERYFPPENKLRMQQLVATLLDAYRRSIDTLDWMSAATKQGAQAKIDKLRTKIGYPDTWRDYARLDIDRADLWGNVCRAAAFDHARQLDKLAQPIDRDEWLMAPQTVNAYYDPVMNEIVFPAALLQPPFFDMTADDAVNYGAIVAVIGHEVSHGFDDKGSQYDADGNLRDWFTPEDHERFAARTRAFVDQYATCESLPGYPVDGLLTLGENIADNAGLALAYKAYQLALAGRPAPIIDGFTGEQRFYLGWVQMWRGKVRMLQAIERIKIDPHSPPEVRGSAPLRNQPGFFTAFGVKPQDRMYLPEDQRIVIW